MTDSSMQNGKADRGLHDFMETPYTFRYFFRQSPVLINHHVRSQGIAPPALDDQFSYLDLGCGNGVSICTFAAALPHGKFHGIDWLPEHIGNARSLAAAGRLQNINFHECSFEESLLQDLPKFDYIAMHGVYSWISEAGRQRVREVITRFLKPGGLVYVSYDAEPGQAARAPMRRLLRQTVASRSGTPIERVEQAIRMLQELQRRNIPLFSESEEAANILKVLTSRDKAYLIHDYLSDHYSALPFRRVAAEMADCNLEFCCNLFAGPLSERNKALSTLSGALSGVDDPVSREDMTSTLLNERYRTDIYVHTDAGHLEANDNGDDFVFGSKSLLSDEKERSRLSAEARKVLESASPGYSSLGNLQSTDDLSHIPPERITQIIKALAGDEFLHPFARKVQQEPPQLSQHPVQISDFNHEILKTLLLRNGICYLASPVTGDGVAVDLITGLFLRNLIDGSDGNPVTAVDDQLKATGRDWRRRGVAVKDPAERRNLLEADHHDFQQNRLSRLTELGIVI